MARFLPLGSLLTLDSAETAEAFCQMNSCRPCSRYDQEVWLCSANFKP